MSKEIVVNSRPYETRIAILDGGEPTEMHIERENRTLVGNIYRGKVVRVLPGMQSAFVDIGLEKDAFLYVEDVIANMSKMLEMWEEDDDNGNKAKKIAKKARNTSEIKKLIKKGENILVQVAKDRIGTKGARITSHITIPGKYLVFMPTVPRIGVSKKITSQDERRRLRDLVKELREPGMGFIIRTAAAGISKRALKQDLDYLQNLWKDITDEADKGKKPGLIHAEFDLLLRVLRDSFSTDYKQCVIDDEEAYVRAVEFLHKNQKILAKRVKLHTNDDNVFEEHGIDGCIESALERKVMLKSGGSIVIHPTEALISIDVNTGRFVGSKSLEDTAFKTNLEAAEAIVQQLRLREMGGIIVIDFIDMEKKGNRQTLIDKFNEELKKDKAEKTVLPLNDFGLVVLTRKRVRGSLEKTLTKACPYCAGGSVVKSNETVAIEVLRELERIGVEGAKGELRVTVNEEVAKRLKEQFASALDWVRDKYALVISVKSDVRYHIEQFDIVEL
jgi:ribonuclease G